MLKQTIKNFNTLSKKLLCIGIAVLLLSQTIVYSQNNSRSSSKYFYLRNETLNMLTQDSERFEISKELENKNRNSLNASVNCVAETIHNGTQNIVCESFKTIKIKNISLQNSNDIKNFYYIA
jgi:hypothetical protein